jgi:hypothetical protein
MKVLNYIRGGIGNQLFQWSIGRAIEIKYGCDTYLDLRHMSIQNGITKREFELSIFPNINYKLIDDSTINEIYQKEVIELTESNFNTYSSELDKEKNYVLFDYWQKYYLIENYINEIISELSCTDPITENLLKKYPNISNNSVSIHIRRTDYLTSNGFHPVQPISYYERALEIIGEYDNIFVFSDDINWCKENLKFKNMTFVENNNSVTDLWLMSFCTNNIIANSSFSWWGALLNKNKNKKVIVPNNWFSYIDVSTMHPKNWIKI